MNVNGEFIFFLLAAIAQVALGTIFLVKPSARPWARAAGMLFIINGGLSVTSALFAALERPSDVLEAAKRFGYLMDPLTSYIILYLALRFPSPMRGLEGRSHWLILVLSVMAVTQFASAVFLDDVLDWLYVSASNGGWASVLYSSFIQEIAWFAVLVRWSHAVLKTKDWKFALLACAIAVRASHVGIVAFGTRINRVGAELDNLFTMSGPAIFHILISALPVVGLLYAFYVLLSPKVNKDTTIAAPEIFTGFLLVGVVEAMFSMASLAGISWTNAPFLYLDLLLLRPVMIWGSLYGMPGTKAMKWTGAAMFFALAAAAFMPSSLDAFRQMQLDAASAWVFSILFTTLMIVLSIRFLLPLLRESAWARRKSILQA